MHMKYRYDSALSVLWKTYRTTTSTNYIMDNFHSALRPRFKVTHLPGFIYKVTAFSAMWQANYPASQSLLLLAHGHCMPACQTLLN